MKRPQARFHYLASILAQAGIGFVAPLEGPPQRKSGLGYPLQVFRKLTGWRYRDTTTLEDEELLQAAADRRARRAQKRHRDYLRCLDNNPCLRSG